MSRRSWIGSCKEKEGVNETVLKAANLWQWMDMDMDMDKGMDMDMNMDMAMEMLGSRKKGRKGHGRIGLARH